MPRHKYFLFWRKNLCIGINFPLRVEQFSEFSESFKKLKISKWNFFPIQNGSKHLKFFQKNEFFQKILRTFWFIQKIENFKIKRFCHTKWVLTKDTYNFFKYQNFSKDTENLLIHLENWKFQKLRYFTIQNRSKYLLFDKRSASIIRVMGK